MKINIHVWLLLITLPLKSQMMPIIAEENIRFELNFCGNKDTMKVSVHNIISERNVSRSAAQLIDPFDYGTFRIEVYDRDSGYLLFTQGFGTLFDEWQTTVDAINNTRCFIQCCRIPRPAHPFRMLIMQRNRFQEFKTVFDSTLDLSNYSFSLPSMPRWKTGTIWNSGDPAHKLDIVFLAEGYRKNEMKRFINHTRKMVKWLFSAEPFLSHTKDINIWTVQSPSDESGTDEPSRDRWRNTAFDTRFNTFNTERYIMTDQHRKVCEAASLVPYDMIVILVNTDVYGGGAIYNHFSVVVAKDRYAGLTLIHETGHCLGGLGDEYYTSEVPYVNLYDTLCEPWEPNLTTLVNFEKKWKHLVHDTVPVPTPATEVYKNTTGAFEGGGYITKGMFRPALDCIMFSHHAFHFCPVCRSVLEKKIIFHTQ